MGFKVGGHLAHGHADLPHVGATIQCDRASDLDIVGNVDVQRVLATPVQQITAVDARSVISLHTARACRSPQEGRSPGIRKGRSS